MQAPIEQHRRAFAETLDRVSQAETIRIPYWRACRGPYRGSYPFGTLLC
jgi:hypothetical protein